MVAPMLTLCLALATGQAAAADVSDSTWLRAIPEEADLAVRFRGLNLVKADLVKMLTAMSPGLAEHAAPALDGLGAQFANKFGEAAAESPMVLLVRLNPPGADGARPFALIVRSGNYEGVKKSIAGGNEVKATAQPGGYEKFDGPDGRPIYSVKGEGYVGFGEDEGLVKGIARPADKPRWTQPLADSFLRGDVGLFVNASAIQDRHGDQIEAMKAQVLAGMDQAANVGGDAMKDAFKGMVGGAFEAIKVADSLAFYLDFEPYGLVVTGSATVRPGTPAAAKLASARPAKDTLLPTLPADGTFFSDIAAGPETVAGLQKLGLAMMLGQAEDEATKKALALFREAGITEMATATFGSTSNLNLMVAADPQKAVDASIATMRAVGEKKGDLGFIKSVKVLPEPRAYKGFNLNEAEIVLDLEKFVKLQPNNPNAAEAARKMYGGDTIHSWVGTDGRRVLSVAAPTWDAARVQIDAVASGVGTVGSLPNYATLREQMPGKTSFLIIGSAQALVRQVASQMAATLPNGGALKPGEMPAEVAVFGAVVVASPSGYQFTLRVPSNNGPVFEKGLTPMIQALQGKVKD